jgi:sensor histidine kinase YesM
MSSCVCLRFSAWIYLVTLLLITKVQAQDTLILHRSILEEKERLSITQHLFVTEFNQPLTGNANSISACDTCHGKLIWKNADSVFLNFMLNINYAQIVEFRINGSLKGPVYSSQTAHLYAIEIPPGSEQSIEMTFYPGQATSMYLQIENPSKLQSALRRYIPKFFDTSYFLKYGFWGLLLLAFLTNFFQYMVRKDRYFLYYASFVLFFFLHNYFYSGSGKILMYTSYQINKLNNLLLPVIQSTYIILYLLFVKEITLTRILKKPLTAYIRISVIGSALFILVYLSYWLFTGEAFTPFAVMYRVAFIGFSLYLFYLTILNKDVLLFIIAAGAFTLLAANALVFYSSFFGWYPALVRHYDHILLAGGIVDIIAFSIAVAYQTHEINRDKIRYLEQLNESNQLNQKMAEEREEALKQRVAEARVQIEQTEREKMETQLQIQQNELEKKALRSQINPHFLFNSLNSLKLYIHKYDKESALTYIDQFSSLLRRLLENTFEKKVSLASEIELIDLYVQLENLRLDQPIEFSTRIKDNIDAEFIQIPAMLIQPFVENAIWHGLVPKSGTDKKITISAEWTKDNIVIISIEDNGIGLYSAENIKSVQPGRKSLGMAITKQRLELINQFNESLYMQELQDDHGNICGTRITMKVLIA